MTILNLGGVSNPQLPATSGTWTFSVVRDDIIREAMLNLALLEESEVPTAQEVTDCARKLNLIVKQLAGGMDKAPGFKMWQRQRGDLFLSPTQGIYTLGAVGDNWAGGVTGLSAPATYNQTTLSAAAVLGATVLSVQSTSAMNLNDFIGIVGTSSIYWTTVAGLGAGTVTIPAPGLPAAAAGGTYLFNYTVKAQRPVEVVTAILRDIQNTDTPLTRMTVEVYEALPTKTQPGFVQDFTAFYYEPQQVNLQGQIFFDASGAQDVTKHIHMVYLREAMDFNNPGDAPEFPQEWFNHLTWALSLAIHGMFDVDWTQGLQQAFQIATGMAREANPQTTQAYFQPDDEDNY
jgi:hypothetical protein